MSMCPPFFLAVPHSFFRADMFFPGSDEKSLPPFRKKSAHRKSFLARLRAIEAGLCRRIVWFSQNLYKIADENDPFLTESIKAFGYFVNDAKTHKSKAAFLSILQNDRKRRRQRARGCGFSGFTREGNCVIIARLLINADFYRILEESRLIRSNLRNVAIIAHVDH
ncbi:MAG: hypothetical protein SOX31_07610, partial [Eubacteriales bacterium]|nr:hypothetical protein [Eubacteriales bacterium]